MHSWTTEDLENVVWALRKALGREPNDQGVAYAISRHAGRRSHLRPLPNQLDPQAV